MQNVETHKQNHNMIFIKKKYSSHIPHHYKLLLQVNFERFFFFHIIFYTYIYIYISYET
jgi:hypothetical protein